MTGIFHLPDLPDITIGPDAKPTPGKPYTNTLSVSNSQTSGGSTTTSSSTSSSTMTQPDPAPMVIDSLYIDESYVLPAATDSAAAAAEASSVAAEVEADLSSWGYYGTSTTSTTSTTSSSAAPTTTVSFESPLLLTTSAEPTPTALPTTDVDNGILTCDRPHKAGDDNYYMSLEDAHDVTWDFCQYLFDNDYDFQDGGDPTPIEQTWRIGNSAARVVMHWVPQAEPCPNLSFASQDSSQGAIDTCHERFDTIINSCKHIFLNAFQYFLASPPSYSFFPSLPCNLHNSECRS